jgi:hypothetical protein
MLLNRSTRVIHDDDPSPQCNKRIFTNKSWLSEAAAAQLVEERYARYCKFCFTHKPTKGS